MSARFNPTLGFAAVPPRREQRTNWIIAQQVDKILDEFQLGRINHEPAARKMIDAGVSLSRIATLLAQPHCRRRAS